MIPSKSTITRLPKNPYSLGIAARYLADTMPFSQFEFGPTIKTLFHQINNDTHLIVEKEDTIAGYLGWLRTTEDIAKAWLEDGGRLQQDQAGDVVAVTVFLADDPKDILKMIKAAKRLEPGVSVYWKRYYTDDRAPSARAVRKRT